jgi:exonuclease V gamma subunit
MEKPYSIDIWSLAQKYLKAIQKLGTHFQYLLLTNPYSPYTIIDIDG